MMILIEGGDATGKDTQSRLLAAALGCEKVSFPRYGTPAAATLEAYLHGDLNLTPYAAAAAFALDRAAWAAEWRGAGEPSVVLDRYVFSNFAYQGARFPTEAEGLAFVEWAKEFEYGKLNLPKPDLMIYLTWGRETRHKLLSERGNAKHDGRDIHEENPAFLDKANDFGYKLAVDEGAVIVQCDGKSREQIHEEIKAIVAKM